MICIFTHSAALLHLNLLTDESHDHIRDNKFTQFSLIQPVFYGSHQQREPSWTLPQRQTSFTLYISVISDSNITLFGCILQIQFILYLNVHEHMNITLYMNYFSLVCRHTLALYWIKLYRSDIYHRGLYNMSKYFSVQFAVVRQR